MIKIVEGNLLDSNANFICHQVNCMGVMGSGVAKQIKDKYPIVFEQYKSLCESRKGCEGDLLGHVQYVAVAENKQVINVFGQLYYGRSSVIQYTDMMSLKLALHSIAKSIPTEYSIAMPYRLGCGLGNGDWGDVMDCIVTSFANHDLTLYRYK